MIKVKIVIRDYSLKEVIKSKIQLCLNNASQVVTFVNEDYVKEDDCNEMLIFFFEIENRDDIKRAKEFKENTHADCIILLSKDESLVFEALRVNPLQFIRVKNLDEDFKNMFQILFDYIKNINTVITLKSGTAILRLNTKSIIFIESFRHYLLIHSTIGEYNVREKLTNIIEEINNLSFIRTHKSYIVNTNFVERIFSDKVILKDKSEIPIGRNFKNEVMQVFNNLAEHYV